MIDFTEAAIDLLAIHWVGNKNEEESIIVSDKLVDMYENPLSELLTSYFLKPFQGAPEFHFTDESSLDLNAVYTFAKEIFEDKKTLLEQSYNICNHLYDTSTHPMIKAGELYVVYFRNCYYEGEPTDAIGIFKSENKDTYLKVVKQDSAYAVSTDDGISIKKLDKGCVIVNVDAENGYRVCSVDNLNKAEDAQFWRDYFLKITAVKNEYVHTKNYMDLCKSFVKDVYNKAHNVEKPDQIDMLNRSLDYFKSNDTFVEEDFKVNVIQHPEVIEAFADYKSTFAEERNIELPDEAFEINPFAMKSAQKNFKSILKLDKNFHIYIHGDRNFIEKGKDDVKGMNYYKLYYSNEN